MSWFTDSLLAPNSAPPCPRCKTTASVARVRTSGGYTIFDCRKCGPVPQKEKR